MLDELFHALTALESVQQQVCCSGLPKSVVCITAGSLNILLAMAYWTATGKLDKHSLNAETDHTSILSVMPAVA